MSVETLEYHHGRHHKAYVDKVNAMLGKEYEGMSLVELIRAAKAQGDQALFDNAAQIWNHSFFWHCLAPPGATRISAHLKQLVDRDFGGQEALVETLAAASVGHFGSGWGWLILGRGKLEVASLHDADTPVAHGMVPLLTVDVWEHAYYIDYRNERPRFVRTLLDHLVNWDFVAQNLDGQGAARADQSP